ncbi:3-keto-5-aminohexanoate cleavage protein [Solirubrobacter ginsenosidimutans]|uniref:3-keto-5-aminohexanoate cleavage protein n=1 Tax=Solirubrobacter ginsenosidimutans TaxID=490573 RepID=A0A9X3N0Q7_9ACTN|nr:3-keto-5-aminohexanoate cleavage protein [Solirubrobacter ginsenosidimutans]MDA0162713.1 3-keto-5-aminohexanoate cleavage protein [Solirubrobacter ginsenosidimutans]
MVLQACLNGDREAGVPRSADELAAASRACVAAGAESLHAHPRDRDGHESLDARDIATAVKAMRTAAPGIEISFSTGLWITGGDVEARARLISEWTVVPDLVSINLSEEGWRELADVVTARGIGIEAGMWTGRDAEILAESGVQVRRVLVEPRSENAEEAVAMARDVDAALDRVFIRAPRLHHGVGAATWAVLDAAVPIGREIRIGLEDVLTLPDGRRAPDNAALVVETVLRYA